MSGEQGASLDPATCNDCLQVQQSEPTTAAYATFLESAARYFEGRPTNGEDAAHWANVYNAKNCREIAAILTQGTPA